MEDEAPQFSRHALAAALMEYDNDPNDPTKPYVDHRRSALFRAKYTPQLPPMQVEQRVRRTWLTGRVVDEEQAHGGMPARPLPFPPGHERHQSNTSGTQSFHSSDFDRLEELDGRGTLPADEVDIDRWGLPDNFISKEVLSRPGSIDLSENRRSVNIQHATDETPARAKSIHLERFEADGDEVLGRQSHDGMVDTALRESERVRRLADGDRRSSIAALTLEDDWQAGRRDPVMIPLPDSPSTPTFPRPMSGTSARASPAGARPMSSMSIPRPMAPDEHDEEVLKNMFDLPAPPPELGSRFDPKTIEAQRRSMDLSGVEATIESRRQSEEFDSTFRAGSTRGSMYSAESPQRPVFEDIPDAEDYGRPLRQPKYGPTAYRVARQELLRPKTLIMPSQLAGTERVIKSVYVPEGFSIGEKPLPADARASILNEGKGVPLSLSQKTFRSSLMVGGRREEEEYFAGEAPEGEVVDLITEDDRKAEEAERRAPGKLFGTSLIDQLEARKNQMRGRQRVFRGDNRPNMMARNSTLINPDDVDLAGDPNANRRSVGDPSTMNSRKSVNFDQMGSFDSRQSLAAEGQMSSLNSRMSLAPSMVPTLHLPEDDDGDLGNPNARMSKSRSVFGVDTIWEREMAKLKNIKDAEARAAAEAELREAQKQAKRKSVFRRTMDVETLVVENSDDYVRPISWHPGMAMARDEEERYDEEEGNEEDRSKRSIAERPPTLVFDPEPTPIAFQEEEPAAPPERRAGSRLGVDDWFQSSDEEDDVPLSRQKGKPVQPPEPQLPQNMHDSDSDADSEDVPLSKLKRVDSEEELPLSQLKQSVKGPSLPALQPVDSSLSMPFASPRPMTPTSPCGRLSPAPPKSPLSKEVRKDEDEDDEPLWLRKERARAAAPEKSKEEIEDDLPLGWKHANALQARPGPSGSGYLPPPLQHSSSFYGNPSVYGMPGMGMPQMGPMMPPMGMGMGPMMGMGGMGGMGMGMGMPPMPPYSSFEQPDPGKNIDNWRKQVPLAPVATGSGRSAASGAG